MSRILVFSKNRPMQLHGYLESLLLFSNIDQARISVLYSHNENIAYDRVKDSFSQVNWIDEVDFEKQLVEWIETCDDDYIMFGCDDVVFKGYFSIPDMESLLKDHDDVFGVSVRLGNNLLGYPANVSKEKGFCFWDWHADKTDNYHYPWELDCTLYRTCDVRSILSKCEIQIKNPNYLEEFVELAPDKYISRSKMACYDEQGKAIAITVNRVQNTHCNPIDNSGPTDPETLSYLYNTKGYKLDINKIAKKKNEVIHVDSSYFITIPLFPKVKKKLKLLEKIKQLYSNLVYLSSVDLQRKNSEDCIAMRDIEIVNLVNNYISPRILSSEETLDLLEKEPKSFTRFGDGELTILSGKSIPFQTFNTDLQDTLKQIIKNENIDMYVGLPYFYYNPTSDLTTGVRNFIMSYGKKYRDIINSNFTKDTLYIDTAITQLYQTYEEYDFSKHYYRLRKLFCGKKVLLIIGEGIFSKYKTNIFDEVKELCLLEAPRKDAYTEIDTIRDRIKEYSKDWLICTVLGPTSKVITLEATQWGYMVWDIGHLIKDYYYYMNCIPRNDDESKCFYMPD